MKRSICALLFFVAVPLFAQQPPEIRFHSVPDLLKLPPDVYVGEATGVAVNSKGHIFVFSRGNTTGPAYAAAAAQLLEFAPDGRFLREIGKNLYAWSFAHSVRVDKEDNIWAVDKGNIYVADRFNRRIQVFDTDGKFLRAMTIDVPFDPAARPAIGNKPDP